VAGWVPQRLRVPLAGLVDAKRTLERGCVLLAFLPDTNHLRTPHARSAYHGFSCTPFSGLYVVAYTCRVQAAEGDEMEGREEGGCYTYALQRWLFLGKGVPLRLVRCPILP
jgi:hypothetical protein